jgi:hypothetical protein
VDAKTEDELFGLKQALGAAQTHAANASQDARQAQGALDQAADRLYALEALMRGPQKPPLLEVRKGVVMSPSWTDRERIMAMFGIDRALDGARCGYTSERSMSLAYSPDGTFSVLFDRVKMTASSGGSSWVCAEIPLPTPVPAAEISYDLEPLAPWDWGASGKLPGLGRWVEGRPAGGGDITPRNFSVRPAWEDYARDNVNHRFGPYVYSQYFSELNPNDPEVYGVNHTSGTLRWIKPLTPSLWPLGPGSKLTVRLGVRTPQGQLYTHLTRDGKTVSVESSARIPFLAADEPPLITHVRFNFMYGGDGPEYGPRLPITALRVSNFRVVELM